MYTLFVILIVIAAFLMIFIVLIQESKGGGLSSNFAGGNALVGVRKTTDLIEKITWGLACAMVVLSVICAYVAPHATAAQSAVEKQAIENPLANPQQKQNFGTTQQQAPAAAEGAQQAAPAAEGAAQQAPAQPAQPAPAPAQPAQ